MILATVIPTHSVATWLIHTIDGVLDRLGLGQDKLTEEILYILVISLISVGVGMGIKRIVLWITQRIVRMRHTVTGTELLKQRVLTKCSHVITPLVFMAFLPFAFNQDSPVLTWIMRIVGIYALIAFGIGVQAVITFIFERYNTRENQKNLPLKGILNVAVGILWIVVVIIAISVIVNKSPGALLAGLGAFAAALMLIFKDSILGFVAGIQMSDNDMLRVGDWIVVPGTPANGNVIDVSLSTVKVRNWDMTIVMVPPYTLVSTSFQNYRGMIETGARRIMNSLTIDLPTVKRVTPEMLADVQKKYPEMDGFIQNLQKQHTLVASNPGLRPMNGTLETNLGLFRAYVGVYLNNHPKIAKDHRILVRIMEATNAGVPLQIWCFTATTNWDEYEGIQSAIMEHLASVVGDFGGLGIYSSSSLTVVEAGEAPAQPASPAGTPAQ